jgi:predicted HicB family RNase H-like nuclease
LAQIPHFGSWLVLFRCYSLKFDLIQVLFDTIFHTGVIGQYDYEQGAEMMHGNVVGITDMIHFCGKTHEEVYNDFLASVEDYLSFCQEVGRIPQISVK